MQPPSPGASGGDAGWDVDNWRLQLEEAVALQSILEDSFKIATAQGLPEGWAEGGAASGPSSSTSAGGGSSEDGHGPGLDPLVLLECDPPPQPVLLSFEATVHVELPQGGVQLLIDTGEGNSGSGNANTAGCGGGGSCSHGDKHHEQQGSHQQEAGGSGSKDPPPGCVQFGQRVQHLPPITAHFSLPHGYPTRSPPCVTLHAIWLPEGSAAQLAAAVKERWQETGAQEPVLYDYLLWLQGNALEVCGITDHLILRDRMYQPLTPAGSSLTQQPSAQAAGPEASGPQKDQQSGGQGSARRQQGSSTSSSSSSQQRGQGHTRQAAATAVAGPEAQGRVAGTVPTASLGSAKSGPQTSLSAAAPPFNPEGPSASVATAAGPSPAQQAGLETKAGGSSGTSGNTSSIPLTSRSSFASATSSAAAAAASAVAGRAQHPHTPGAALVTEHITTEHQHQQNHHQGTQGQGPVTGVFSSTAVGNAAAAHAGGRVVAAADQVATAILRYSAAREQADFEAGFHRCPICFESVLGSKCVCLPECGHSFCRDCFTQYCTTKVADGQVETVRCPEPSCTCKSVGPGVLKAVLTPDQFERWEALLLQRTLDQMSDVVYCPRCQAIVLEDKDHCAMCPKCLYCFCALCDDAWHPGVVCMDAQARLEKLSERLSMSALSDEERRRRRENLIEAIKSQAVIKNTSTPCPGCGMAISKSSGCNKMECAYCSTKFCFVCGENLDTVGYGHFSNNPRCNLLDNDAIMAWERQMAMLDFDAPYQQVRVNRMVIEHARNNPDIGPVRFVPCPTCGQVNMKDGRLNLIRCYACSSHFCCVCMSALRVKPGLHFKGNPRCKQHSDN